MKVKLASYNIQYGVGKDEQLDLRRIVTEFGDADIVALQEVEANNPARGLIDQPAEIARLSALDHSFHGSGIDLYLDESLTGGRRGLRLGFGNMILSRWPILSATNHTLPKVGLHGTLHLQRTMIEAVIDTPAGALRFCCTHLDHVSPLNRMPQTETLRTLMLDAARRGGPWGGAPAEQMGFATPAPTWPLGGILMGDLNFLPGTREYEHLAGDLSPILGRRVSPLEGLFDAWTLTGHAETEGSTFVKDGRPMRFDYCFVTSDYLPAVQSMWIDETAVGSDHQPIFVTLDLAA